MKLTTLPLLATLALGAAGTMAAAQDMEYLLINSTSATVLEFYTSPVDVDTWENDLLANADLMPGQQVTVTIGDGRTQCDYDVLFIFDDGEELTDTVNICELGSYELTE